VNIGSILQLGHYCDRIQQLDLLWKYSIIIIFFILFIRGMHFK